MLTAPDITVVGEARDGVEAVELAQQLHPDVITMDVHMPQLDGLEATRRIMVSAPTPILVVTSLDTRDVELSFEATAAGALLVIEKPMAPTRPGFDAQRAWLIDMVRAMSQVKVVRRWHRARSPVRPAPPVRTAVERPRAQVVAIAASTGGPAAVRRVLEMLPTGFRAPVLLVQHIAHGFTDGFVQWLGHGCSLTVKIAEDGELLRPGVVYVAPDDQHLCAHHGGVVAVSKSAPRGGFRPSADRLFESVARTYGARAAAAILTGMGRDGVEGLAALHAAGGFVVAQDEATSIVYGMPQEAARAGVVHIVSPIERIAPELTRVVTGES